MFGAAIALLIFLHFTKLSIPAESLVVGFFRPIFPKFYATSSYFRNLYNEQADKRDFAAENKKLKEEINHLTVKNSRLNELEEENNTLRKYLNFFKENNTRYLMADIISSEGSESGALGQTVIINKGSNDGLKEGLAVVSNRGIILGKIKNVKDVLSEVSITTNQACKLAATIQNQDRTAGVAEGDLGLTIKMNFIPQTKEVKTGDVVITSGLEENIPRGLIIGAIVKVDKENNQLWQSATIEPLIDVSNLAQVSVLFRD